MRNSEWSISYQRGFTLIELLVVIAIIALLLSILMPSLQKIKNLGRAITCQSHIKGYYLSNTMFAMQHEKGQYVSPPWIVNQEFLSLVGTDVNNEQYAGNADWYYAPFDEDLICPSSLVARKGVDMSNPGANGMPATYGYNEYGKNWYDTDFYRPAQIKSPGSKVMFIDCADVNLNTLQGPYTLAAAGMNYQVHWDVVGDFFGTRDGVFHAGNVSYRHGEKASIVFHDGHADRLAKEECWVVVNGSSDNGQMATLWNLVD